MKKKYRLVGSFPAKVIAMILLTCSVFAVVVGGFSIIMMENYGVYSGDKESFERQLNERVFRKYSVMAVVGNKFDYDKQELGKTNFRYGIIRTDDFKAEMIRDRDAYVYDAFDDDFGKVMEEESYFKYSCHFDQNSEYGFEEGLFGDAWIYNQRVVVESEAEDISSESDEETFTVVTTEDTKLPDNFYVISYIADPLIVDPDLSKNDLFGQARFILNAVYGVRYLMVWIFLLGVIVFTVCFFFLMRASGRRVGEEELTGHFWDKIPLIISLALVAVVDGCAIAGAAGTLSYLIRSNVMEVLSPFCWIAILLCGVAGTLTTMWWLMSLSYHIKNHSVKSSILTYRFWVFCKSGVENGYGVLKLLAGGGGIRRVLLFLISVFFIEQFVFVALSGGNFFGYLLWMIEIVAGLILIGKVLPHLEVIFTSGEKMAAGDFDHRIETGDMPKVLKEHADHLNSIGEGMNQAVAERMKSEKFKTELITNVSHDIKTPLTSIINYADLLEREKIDDPKAQEYLEVLKRQSAKLKKLIEDLIEASKASTGNLSVELCRLDAAVVMDQVVGEFEEKLSDKELKLIVCAPEPPVYILADSRHLWRVLDNLLGNICKYAMPGTRAYIDLVEGEDRTQIIFKNVSGEPLNITSEELLERFVRADSSRHTEGNGLGLSIAQSLMELMEGKLELFVDGDLFKVELTFKKA